MNFDLRKTPPPAGLIHQQRKIFTEQQGSIRRRTNLAFGSIFIVALAALQIPGSDPNFQARVFAGIADNLGPELFFICATAGMAFIFGAADSASRRLSFWLIYMSTAIGGLALLNLVAPAGFCQGEIDATPDLIAAMLLIGSLALVFSSFIDRRIRCLQRKVEALSPLPDTSRVHADVAGACDVNEECRSYVEKVMRQGRVLMKVEAEQVVALHREIESRKRKEKQQDKENNCELVGEHDKEIY